MEEKELDLCEFLKGCEGQEFYSIIDGPVKLDQIMLDTNYPLVFRVLHTGECATYNKFGYYRNSLVGTPILFPTQDLYRRYPFNYKKSWEEWKEMNKVKYEISLTYSLREKNSFHENIRDLVFEYNTLENAEKAIKEVEEILRNYEKL